MRVFCFDVFLYVSACTSKYLFLVELAKDAELFLDAIGKHIIVVIIL